MKYSPYSVNILNEHGRDALMTICFHGYHPNSFEIATTLLQHGANATIRDQVRF